MQLTKALRFSETEVAAFVGAGGKTTALFIAARELSSVGVDGIPGKTVIVTTTTHLGSWQKKYADYYFQVNSDSDLLFLEQDLPIGIVLLIGREVQNRLTGLTDDRLLKVLNIARDKQVPLLIEADGSGGCPLKAPSSHEPVIPGFVRDVVVVAGMTGLGKPLTKEWVHRPEIFAELGGMSIGEQISVEALSKVLISKDGGLKNIPSTARKIMLLNQADDEELQAHGRAIAQRIYPGYSAILITSLQLENQQVQSVTRKEDQQARIYAVVEQIGGIILAAGGSSRFGKPKQLLHWNGQPFIRHITLSSLNAGLSPVNVVVGSSADEVSRAISDLPVNIIFNPNWEIGLSSSIHAGIKALPDFVGGAIFMQADQPQTTPSLIRKIIETHQASLAPIVAPQIDGQRGNPVLFDSQTFDQLLSIEGDHGGRALFQKYSIQWVTWHDRAQMMDIDTPEDYQKFTEFYEGRG